MNVTAHSKFELYKKKLLFKPAKAQIILSNLTARATVSLIQKKAKRLVIGKNEKSFSSAVRVKMEKKLKKG